MAQAIERGRRASREQLDRILAVELARLDGPARRRRLASLDALLGPEAWDLLRSAHGLAPDQARLAVREAVHTLLTQGAPKTEPTATAAAAAAAGSARSTASAGHLGASGAGGTDHALAEIDERIERLVAAIESGAPAELVAPRLRTLTEARAALAPPDRS